MKLLRGLGLLGILALLACPAPGPPLTKPECTQLLRRQQEVLSSDLRGDQLRDFEASSATTFDAEVADCVQGLTWSRRGYDCVAKAATQEEMRHCANRN